jgi:hypothetical protein
MIARALVDPAKKSMVCRAMNTTDRPVRLQPRVAVGTLAAVSILTQHVTPVTQSVETLPTVDVMREALQKLGVSFVDTAVSGQDLDKLITLLFRNRDLIATDLKNLPGTDILFHNIDTGSHLPIKKRSFRQSPKDRDEIERQIAEMHEANIIEPSESAWGSPILLVDKRDGTRRFCIDFRELNAVTKLASWPLPTLDEVLDSVAEQRPVLWTSMDLKSGYWQAFLDPESRKKLLSSMGDRTGNSGAWLLVSLMQFHFSSG